MRQIVIPEREEANVLYLEHSWHVQMILQVEGTDILHGTEFVRVDNHGSKKENQQWKDLKGGKKPRANMLHPKAETICS